MRGWSEKTVLRAAPCLFGLFSVIALLYARLPVKKRVPILRGSGHASSRGLEKPIERSPMPSPPCGGGSG